MVGIRMTPYGVNESDYERDTAEFTLSIRQIQVKIDKQLVVYVLLIFRAAAAAIRTAATQRLVGFHNVHEYLVDRSPVGFLASRSIEFYKRTNYL